LLPSLSPFLPLTEALRRTGGRNNQGRTTLRYRGGGAKQRYRLVDFRRKITDVPGIVRRLEHDPNRNAHIALVQYPDRRMQYVIAPQGLNVGDRITSSRSTVVEIKPGNAMRLRDIPIGTTISCIELLPGHGAQYMRSAGTSAQLLEKTSTGRKNHALVRIHSKEVRLVPLDSMATIGVVSNALHRIRSYGKAGRIRWMGRRGGNRGLARNPVDHPHGGGAAAGRPGRPSCSPTGVLAKGFKTRSVRKRNPNIVAMRGGVKVRSK
jgi:large subunit ribosomal protein L2